jgi:hypothetical protein
MRSVIGRLIAAAFLSIGCSSATAEPIAEITNYGIYVVVDDGYVKVEPYLHDYSFVGSVLCMRSRLPFGETNR